MVACNCNQYLAVILLHNFPPFWRPRVYCAVVPFDFNFRLSFRIEALYSIWCGVNRPSDSGVNRLGDTSAFVNPAGQLLLTRRGKTRMYGVGIAF